MIFIDHTMWSEKWKCLKLSDDEPGLTRLINIEYKDFKTLVAGFDKLQSEIVILRKEMVKTVADSVVIRECVQKDLETLEMLSMMSFPARSAYWA